MMKIDLAASFRVGDILTLSRVLLDKFIGDEKADGVARHGDSQAVTAGEIAFVRTREAGGVSPVGEVLQDRRIKIATSMKTVHAGRKAVRCANQGDTCGSICSGKTSAAGI